jgi:hypothetical protein
MLLIPRDKLAAGINANDDHLYLCINVTDDQFVANIKDIDDRWLMCEIILQKKSK